jgi:hypothetical protein
VNSCGIGWGVADAGLGVATDEVPPADRYEPGGPTLAAPTSRGTRGAAGVTGPVPGARGRRARAVAATHCSRGADLTGEVVFDIVRILCEWQYDGAPVQLHPGDLGWHWRRGGAGRGGTDLEPRPTDPRRRAVGRSRVGATGDSARARHDQERAGGRASWTSRSRPGPREGDHRRRGRRSPGTRLVERRRVCRELRFRRYRHVQVGRLPAAS